MGIFNNITNAIYGKNMQRKDAEPKMFAQRGKGFKKSKPVEDELFGTDNVPEWKRIEQENEFLSSCQRKGE